VNLEAARTELEALATRVAPGEGRIALELDGDVAWLRLDNPKAHNALTIRMMAELGAAVARLAEWTGACLVLAPSTEGTFCSGGHLDQVQQALIAPDQGHRMARAMGVVLDALLDLPVVSVAAVDGPAIGGGAELTTACDLRVIRWGARVHFVHARLGVAPGWGGTGRLVRLLGRRTALRLLAEARPVQAEEAVALGLADAACEGPAAEGALELLAPIRALPVAAVRAVKGQVSASDDREAQAARFAEVWGGPDHRAALRALGRRSSG